MMAQKRKQVTLKFSGFLQIKLAHSQTLMKFKIDMQVIHYITICQKDFKTSVFTITVGNGYIFNIVMLTEQSGQLNY